MKARCSLILIWLLCAAMLPAVVQAQFTFTTNNDGSLNIQQYTGLSSIVVIPSTTNGLPVTSIGAYAFNGRMLSSITIPNGIGSIGLAAFANCSGLTSVTIPDSVTNIDEIAFWQCPTLTTFTLGKGITNIANDFLHGCSSLKTIAVDTNNPAYSSVAGVLFNKNQTILDIFPPSNTGNYTIPNSVTNIGNWAISYSSILTNITIPASVITISDTAFASCTNLTSLTIPDSVTSIGTEVFYECTGLTNISIPDSVTSIGTSAFYRCTGLARVTIGNGLAIIGSQAFYGCTSLTAITVDNNNPVYSSLDGVLFNKSQTMLIQFPSGKPGSYTIPNSVTAIGNLAFIGCINLTSLTIPNSIIYIGGGIIVMPALSVTTIGGGAFSGCSSLASVYFTGNSPTPTNDSSVFSYDNNPTIYYLPGTTGWGSTFDGRPTAPWFLPNPTILNFEPNFGVQTNCFGFTISWATNIPVVVESCTNLANPFWSLVGTNVLAGGTSYFSDSLWTNFPSRYYRLRSP